jgi:PST family polysaccharide transporter
MQTPPTEAPSLKQRTRKGVIWAGVITIGSKALSVITTLVLARILVPADYGLIGVASVVIAALTIFTDLGLGAAIVHSRNDRQRMASTAFFLMPMIALVLYAVAYVTAPAISNLLQSPGATGVVRLLSLSLVFSSLSVVPSSLLEKDMAYRRKVIPELLPYFLYMGVAIVLAAAFHAGAYSIAWGQIIQSLAALVLYWFVAGWRPSMVFDGKIARELISYSKHVLGGSIMVYLATNMDNIFVGRTNGTAALGFYTLAYSIANLPATHVSDVVGRVMFPALVEINEDHARLTTTYLEGMEAVTLVTLPILAGMAGLAAPFVHLVLGIKWLPIITSLAVLTVFTAARVVAGVTGPLFLAAGKPRLIFITGLSGLLLQAVFLTVFVSWMHLSFTGASIAVSVASLINIFYIAYFVLRLLHVRTVPVRGILAMLTPAVVMLLALYGLQRLAAATNFLVFIVEGVIGLAVYIGCHYALGGGPKLRKLADLMLRKGAQPVS